MRAAASLAMLVATVAISGAASAGSLPASVASAREPLRTSPALPAVGAIYEEARLLGALFSTSAFSLSAFAASVANAGAYESTDPRWGPSLDREMHAQVLPAARGELDLLGVSTPPSDTVSPVAMPAGFVVVAGVGLLALYGRRPAPVEWHRF